MKYDAIVIGSGFGGSVVSCRLSMAGHNVLLLERGKEYKKGDFPRGISNFKKAFWHKDKELYGMYDYRSYKNIDVVSASGLGGGSLIYSNVTMRKPEDSFAGWPITRKELDPYYDRVENILDPSPLPIHRKPYSDIPKTRLMREHYTAIPDSELLYPDLAVCWGNGPGVDNVNKHGVDQAGCTLCGECAVGCNVRAKNSLDLNYLHLAKENGLNVLTNHIADRIEPIDDGYKVHFEKIEESGEKVQGTVSGKLLILSAGCLGSTEMLLRNRDKYGTLPRVSQRLGSNFSANADFTGASFSKHEVNSSYGPVITSVVKSKSHVIEDGGIPDFMAWYFEGMIPSVKTTFSILKNAWHYVMRSVGINKQTRIGHDVMSLMEGENIMSGMFPYFCMGLDKADGHISLNKNGYAEIKWNFRSNKKILKEIIKDTRYMHKSIGGTYLAFPTWYMKKLLTTHPLGGCPMSESSNEGVVNPDGEVFGYKGLYVVDGSILPGAVGVNPSMTIAAMAEKISASITSSIKEPSTVGSLNDKEDRL